MRLQRVVPSIALFVPLVTSLIALLYTTDAVHQSYAKEHAHVKASRSPTYTGDFHSTGSGNGAGREINLNIELAGGKGAFADVPSTVHSFSSLQITNTHKTDVVTIKKVETRPLGDLTNIPQITSTVFQHRTLQINPGSSVILPLGFIPQMPASHHQPFDENEGNYNDGDGTGKKKSSGEGRTVSDNGPSPALATISKSSAADLASILNVDPMHLGQDHSHKLKTTILVTSSRGVVKMIVDSSTTRRNPFKLPPTIVFEKDGYINSDTIFTDQTRQEFRNISARRKGWKKEVGYQYDLYIDNPSEEFLHIMEIYPTKPEFVHMEYAHGSGIFNTTEHNPRDGLFATYNDGREVSSMGRFNNCGLSREAREFCNLPKSLEITGPLRVGPAGLSAYIGTIAFNKETIESGGLLENVDEQFLGYLMVKCNKVFLSIALEYIAHDDANDYDPSKVPKLAGSEPILDANGNVQSSGKSKTSREPVVPNEPIVLDISRKQNSLKKCDRGIPSIKPVLVPQGPHLETSHHDEPIQIRVPDSMHSPSFVDFGFLAINGDERKFKIGIKNTADMSLKLMHHSVQWEDFEHDDLTSWIDISTRYQNSVVNKGDTNDDFPSESGVIGKIVKNPSWDAIPPGVTTTDLVHLSLDHLNDVSSPFKSNNLGQASHQGVVILRFGPGNQSLENWKIDVAKNPLSAQEYAVEIPFIVHLIQGELQYDAYQSYFPAKYAPSRTETGASQCKAGFDRVFNIKNKFAVPLRVRGFAIRQTTGNGMDDLSPKLCSRAFHIIDYQRVSDMASKDKRNSGSDQTSPRDSLGNITLRYNYIENEQNLFFRSPKKCSLVIDTDEMGEFHIPLWVYTGTIIASPEKSIAPAACQEVLGDRHSKSSFGIECLKVLDKNTSFGTILGSIVSQGAEKNEKKKGQAKWLSQVTSYLSSMKSHKDNILEPIILSLGAMSSDTVETRSLFITNNNPIPIKIKAIVSSIEGMAIRLGQTPSNLDQIIQNAKVNKSTNDTDRLKDEWMKRYLTTVPGPVMNYLQSFTHRDDISISATASNSMKMIFQGSAALRLRRKRTQNQHDVQNLEDTVNLSNDTVAIDDSRKERIELYPPAFGNEILNDNIENERAKSPMKALLATTDRSVIQSLKVIDSYDGKKSSTWIVPPGGVARFEVSIRSPSKDALRNSDFAEVITSGLALETDGQFMPIIATYKSLSGKLSLSASEDIDPSKSNSTTEGIIDVSSVFRPSGEKLRKGENGRVGVLFQNDFSKDVELIGVRSCNKWFEIEFNRTAGKKVKRTLKSGKSVGAHVRTNLSCLGNSGPSPSFFHCALQWIEKRREIEESYCAVSSDASEAVEYDSSIKMKAIEALKSMADYMDSKYGKHAISTNSFGSAIGFITPDIYRKVQQALIEWDKLSDLGLHKITGALQAKFELLDKSDVTMGTKPSITTTFSSPSFQADLKCPFLYDQGDKQLRFEPTGLSEISELYIPLTNPTGFPVSVRLSALAEMSSQFFMQQHANEINNWWSGGAYVMADERGSLSLSEHNITIRTPTGASLSLVTPSLHATSALFNGCGGRRCGVMFPSPNDQPNQPGKDLKQRSIFGASSAAGVSLTGRLYNRDGSLNFEGYSNSTNDPQQPFALGVNVVKEVTLLPYGSAKLGPIYFRPSSRREFYGALALENSMTGLEILNLRGRGTIEKLEFFDSEDNHGRGGDIEMRFGKSAMIFNSVHRDEYGRGVKTVFIANLGDTTINIKDIYLAPSGVTKDTSNFRQKGPFDSCHQRGFRLLGCEPYTGKSETDGSELFFLRPNHSKTLHISHKYDCNFESMFVSLIIEHGDNTKGSITKQDHSELLLGYQMGEDEAKSCRSSKMWQIGGDFFRSKDKEKKPNFSSFGIYIWTSFIPIAIFSGILLDMISSAKQRQASAISFQSAILSKKSSQSKNKKTGFKNWSSAYRCLSRADPNSSELVQLGREQSRQILLNAYKKEGIIQPQCVMPNGTFTRETREQRSSISKGGDGQASPTKRISSSPNKMTLNDAIFTNQYSFDSRFGDAPVMPSGLGWRVLSSMHSAANAQLSAKEAMKSTPRKIHKPNSSQKNDKPRSRPQVKIVVNESTEQKIMEQKVVKPTVKANELEDIKHVNTVKVKPQEIATNEKREAQEISESSDVYHIASDVKPKIDKEVSESNSGRQAGKPTEDILLSPKLAEKAAIAVDIVMPTKLEQSMSKSGSRIDVLQNSKEMDDNCKMLIPDTQAAVKLTKEEDSEAQAVNEGKVPGQSSVEIKSKPKGSSRKRRGKGRKKTASDIIPNASQEVFAEDKVDSSVTIENDITSKKYNKREVEPASSISLSPKSPSRDDINKNITKLKESPTKQDAAASKDTNVELSGDNKEKAETGTTQNATVIKSPQKNKKNGQSSGKRNDIRTKEETALPVSSPSVDDPGSLKTAKSNVSIEIDPEDSSSNTSIASEKVDPETISLPTDSESAEKRKGRRKRRRKGQRKRKNDKTEPSANDTLSDIGKTSANDSPQEAEKMIRGSPVRQASEQSFGVQSTTSEGSGSTSSVLLTPTRMTHSIRPPPGLAPPPGFGLQAPVDTSNTSSPVKREDHPQSIDENDALRQSLENFTKANTVMDAALLNPDSGTFDGVDDQDEAKPMLGIGQDLNVMNFLNFLDESFDQGADDDGADDEGESPALTEDNNYAPLSLNLGGLAGLSVSKNPWADSHTPRAYAYGFEVEQIGKGGLDNEDQSGADLLTPSMILGQNGTDPEGEKDEDSFDADTFFSSLLNDE